MPEWVYILINGAAFGGALGAVIAYLSRRR